MERFKLWWSEQTFLFQFFRILLLVMAVPVSLFILNQSLHFFSIAAVPNGLLSLPKQATATVGQEFPAGITMDTGGKDAWGVDVVLRFDPKFLRLTAVHPLADKTTTLETFAPVDSEGIFDQAGIITQANTTGVLKFGALAAKIDNWQTHQGKILKSFNGTAFLANLRFVPLQNGTSTVAFSFSPCSLSQCSHDGSNIATDADIPGQALEMVENMTVVVGPTSGSSTPSEVAPANVNPENPGQAKAITGSGDVSGDHQIDFSDIQVIIASYSRSVVSVTDPLNQYNDGSGLINSFDFAVVAKKIKY